MVVYQRDKTRPSCKKWGFWITQSEREREREAKANPPWVMQQSACRGTSGSRGREIDSLNS